MCISIGVGTTSIALGDDGVLDIDSTISLEIWHAMEELVSMRQVRSIRKMVEEFSDRF
jgi:aldehyde reductase